MIAKIFKGVKEVKENKWQEKAAARFCVSKSRQKGKIFIP